MISRIYVTLKGKDTRADLYRKTWTDLGLVTKSQKIQHISIVDSYLLVHDFNTETLMKIAGALTNPVLEEYSIDNKFEDENFDWALEIGYLPGVTDNAAHTTKETIKDLLHLDERTLFDVYTSKLFLIKANVPITTIEKIAEGLHNSLIERSYIVDKRNLVRDKGLPKVAPVVWLENKTPCIKVSLNVSDEELIKIGKEGIKEEDGTRRGPLALDLLSMQTIQKYFAELRRDPTDIELESLAQTWSEHCKHTIFANPIDDISEGLYKTYIKGATNEIRKRKGKNDFCVSVFSDNAGGIIFDKEYLITHKVETHNSPSALDPFGGAITGIVGVNRDTIGFGLGAKPVANTYGFCFGEPDDLNPIFRDAEKKQKMFLPKRIMDGVIKGINVGGNCSGIPTLSGFVKYDDRFKGKPLVFAGTVGLIPQKINNKPSHEKEAQAGDYIVVVGGRVGRDGIHGATFSSVAMDTSSPATAVQIGDPITQKKLSDALVKEARAMDLYNSITDNGAGGISCSVAEMAKECGGAKVFLEKVPLKYPGLRPWEIWISESQERMTLAIPKEKWRLFNILMQSRGVEAVVIGEFTNSGKCLVSHEGKTIVDLPLEFLHNGLPKRNLKTQRVEVVHPDPILPKGKTRTKELESLLAINNIAGFSFISEQYDHEVQASSVLKPLSGRGRINTEAQVFRPVLSSEKGVVLSTGVYPSYGDISTYHMAACALDTAVRNIVATGGTLSHLAILDNFCWCSSYDEKRLGQLVDSIKACYEHAVGYGTPFISGKDSMFNDFKGYDGKGRKIEISIPPTLLISAIGVMQNINNTVSPEFKNPKDVIYLLGETHNELGASEYFKMLAKGQRKPDAIGNSVPQVNIQKNTATYFLLEQAIQEGLIVSSLSLTSGGLAVALAKASLGGLLGCDVSIKNLAGTADTLDSKLFSESQGRILLSVNSKNVRKFEKILKNASYSKLGTVTKNGNVIIKDGETVVKTNVNILTQHYHKFSNTMQ